MEEIKEEATQHEDRLAKLLEEHARLREEWKQAVEQLRSSILKVVVWRQV